MASADLYSWVPDHGPAARIRRLEYAEADRLALGAAVLIGRLALPIARAAASFADRRGWHDDGFALAHDYARERLGRSGGWLRGMARLGRAVGQWPALEQALLGQDGPPLGTVAALWVIRVATGETVEQWIALARGCTVRALKDQVTAAQQAGSAAPRPQAPGPEEAEPEAPEGDEEPEDDAGRRARLSFPLTPAGREAFHSGLDLFHAVQGYRAPVQAFVEALVAEYAGRHGWAEVENLPPSYRAALRRATRAAAERARPPRTRYETENIRAEDGLFAAVRGKLEVAFRLLNKRAWADALEAHDDLRVLVKLEGELGRLLGRLLAQLAFWRAWRDLGFLDLGQYAEERLGLARTTAQDLAQAARFALHSPAVAKRYATGELSTRKAVLLAREFGEEAGDEVLEGWLDKSRRATVKWLEDGLKWRRRQLDLGKPGPDIPPDTAVWRASIDRRREAYRQRLAECRAVFDSGPDGVVAFGICLPPELAARLLGALCVAQAKWEGVCVDQVAGRLRLLPFRRQGRMFSTLAVSGIGDEAWFALLEEFVAEWQPLDPKSGRQVHPAIQRDGYRCTAPGCTARRGLERHHIRFLSHRGPRHTLENQTALCWHHHHNGIHRRSIEMAGSAPQNLRFMVGPVHRRRIYHNEDFVADLSRFHPRPGP